MSEIKATVKVPFYSKGKHYEKDEAISLTPHAAKIYANVEFIELDKATEAKVDKAVEKATEKAAKEAAKDVADKK